MSGSVHAFFEHYAGRYEAHDADGVADRCEVPFLAVRGGVALHLGDREAVAGHFSGIFTVYRGLGVTTWSAVAIDSRGAGPHAAFATVHWHAMGADGSVVRDNAATYHLLAGDDGWRMLSYTFHG